MMAKLYTTLDLSEFSSAFQKLAEPALAYVVKPQVSLSSSHGNTHLTNQSAGIFSPEGSKLWLKLSSLSSQAC